MTFEGPWNYSSAWQSEVLGVPDHTESWIDDQIYLHLSDVDAAIANYSKARRLQEAGSARVSQWRSGLD